MGRLESPPTGFLLKASKKSHCLTPGPKAPPRQMVRITWSTPATPPHIHPAPQGRRPGTGFLGPQGEGSLVSGP